MDIFASDFVGGWFADFLPLGDQVNVRECVNNVPRPVAICRYNYQARFNGLTSGVFCRGKGGSGAVSPREA